MEKETKTAKALIDLLSSHVSGNAKPLSEDVSVDGICHLAKKHGLLALAASALEKTGQSTEKTREYKARAIRKIMLLDAERAAISAELSKREIPHIPLKGVLLKELYPSLGDREMSDNDILVDESRRHEVREIFVARGYEVKSFGGAHDDVYMKPPVYNFEMHVSLFSENESSEFSKYFSSALENSLPDAGYRRKLSDEDFYLYITAHEYKHFSRGGTGLRSLLDAYLFLSSRPELDGEKIKSGLLSLGISEYESCRTSLANKLFCSATAESREGRLSEDEEKMLSYVLGSGTYGTEKNVVENEIARAADGGSKGKYILRRLFPKTEWYKDNAPFVYRHKILIPFYLIKRLLVKLLLSPGKIIRELKLVKKAKGK